MVGALCSTYAQSMQTTPPATGKTNQASLFNDLYGGYGAGSIFYFTGKMSHSSDYPTVSGSYGGMYLVNTTLTDPTSAGTFFLGYGRTLNEVVSMGFMFGFQEISYSGISRYRSSQYTGNDTILHLTNNDFILSGIARILFSYVNKPIIRVYSGVGIGITINLGKAKLGSEEFTDRKLYPAGQLTLMGIRFGRALGGFFEFGFGSYGIINAGLSYKFKD
jgi:hypothetical protein